MRGEWYGLLFASLLALSTPALAQVESDFSTGGGVRIGASATACAAGIAGAIRYTSGTPGSIDFCNGSNWVTLGSSAPPAGADTEIQFNGGGVFAASDRLQYDYANGTLWVQSNYATADTAVFTNNDQGAIHIGKYGGTIDALAISSNMSATSGNYCDSGSEGWLLRMDGFNDVFAVVHGVCSGTGAPATLSEFVRVAGSGNVGIGNFTSDTVDSTLHLVGSGSAIRLDDVAGNEAGCIRYNDTSNVLEYSNDCSSYTTLGSGGGGAINDLTDAAADYTSNNIFLGANVGAATTTGDTNTAIGSGAFDANTTGSANAALGYNAMAYTTSGSYNSALGNGALASNVDGSNNVAVGQAALYYNANGVDNVAIGRDALGANTSGSNNTAVGHNALSTNTGGSAHTAVGYRAMANANTTNSGTALGYQALAAMTTGGGNTAVGYQSLTTVSTNGNNTAVGDSALGNATGSNNTALGFSAGDTLTTGSNNILIGYEAEPSAAGASNELNIGNTIYGNLSTDWVGIGVASPGAQMHINTTSTAGNTVLEALRLSHEDTNSGGAANIGAAMTFSLETATNNTFAESARIASIFTDATANSKDADLIFYTMGPNASGSTTTERMRISGGGVTTITGPGTDAAPLVVRNNAETGVEVFSASATAFADAYMAGMRSRGTVASPTIVSSGDSLLGIAGYGYDGSSYEPAAFIGIGVDGTPGNSDMPGAILFYTSPDGSNTPLERMRINSAGNVGIGNFTSDTVDSALHLVGSGSAIRLDDVAGNQAGCIRYNDTSDVIEYSHTCSTYTALGGAGTPAGADTQIQFNSGGAFGASSNLTWNNTATRLGISAATAMPNVSYDGSGWLDTPKLHVEDGALLVIGDNTAVPYPNIYNFHFNSTAGTYPGLIVGRGRGSMASRTVVSDGDWLGSVGFAGYDGSNMLFGAEIVAQVSAPPGSIDMPTSLLFKTVPDGSQTLATRMVIDQDGNVGIGTGDSEGHRLLVVSDDTMTPMIIRNTDVSGWSSIGFDDAAGGAAGWVGYGNSSAPNMAGQVYLEAGGTAPLGFWTNGAERMRITTTGNVGIGTSSPQSTLHVPDGNYLQAEDNNAGAPPAADCDANAERGRLSIDTTNNRLYVCNGATRGWDYTSLTD